MCGDAHVYNLMRGINVNVTINIALTYVNKNPRKICPNNVSIPVAANEELCDVFESTAIWMAGDEIPFELLYYFSKLSPFEIHSRNHIVTGKALRWKPWNSFTRQMLFGCKADVFTVPPCSSLSLVKTYPFAMVYCHCFYSSPVWNCQRANHQMMYECCEMILWSAAPYNLIIESSRLGRCMHAFQFRYSM